MLAIPRERPAARVGVEADRLMGAGSVRDAVTPGLHVGDDRLARRVVEGDVPIGAIPVISAIRELPKRPGWRFSEAEIQRLADLRRDARSTSPASAPRRRDSHDNCKGPGAQRRLLHPPIRWTPTTATPLCCQQYSLMPGAAMAITVTTAVPISK